VRFVLFFHYRRAKCEHLTLLSYPSIFAHDREVTNS